MEIKVKRQMGEAMYEFSFNGDFKEVMKQSSFLLERDICTLEGFRDLPVEYDVREVDTPNGKFIYVKRRCKNLEGQIASSTLGQYKNGGYFWKEWEIYKPEEKRNENGTLKPDVEPHEDTTPF